jgi:hypothetical protein
MEERERERRVEKFYKLTGMRNPHGIHVYDTQFWRWKCQATATLVVPPSAGLELVTATVTQGGLRRRNRHFDPFLCLSKIFLVQGAAKAGSWGPCRQNSQSKEKSLQGLIRSRIRVLGAGRGLA